MSSAEDEDEGWTTFLGKRVLFPPVVAARRAYLVTEDNTLCAVDLPKTWRGQRRVVWKMYLSATVHEPPQLKDGLLYIGSIDSPYERDGLMCIESGSGRLLWRWRPSGQKL